MVRAFLAGQATQMPQPVQSRGLKWPCVLQTALPCAFVGARQTGGGVLGLLGGEQERTDAAWGQTKAHWLHWMHFSGSHTSGTETATPRFS